MKIQMILLTAILFAANAHAETLLIKSSNRGSVAPDYQQNSVCTLGDSQVRILVTAPSIQFPRALIKQIKFTQAVPNLDVAKSLVVEASRGVIQQNIGPIGGGIVSYSARAPLTTQSFDLLIESGTLPVRTNQSSAAKKLIQFLDANCN